jgi:RND family efflux transporter MFP subunit
MNLSVLVLHGFSSKTGLQDSWMLRTFSTFVMTLCMGFALTGCSKTESAGGRVSAGTAIGVRVVPAQEESNRTRVEAVGSLFALDESTISSQVEGPVSRIMVDVGDIVKEGQVLVAIEPTELQYVVETQRATVRQVRSQLGIGPNDPPPSDPSKVAFVQRAAADLFDAKTRYDRSRLLFQSQVVPQGDVDAAMAKYDNAKAAHDLAIQQVEQLAAQLQSSETMLRLAEKKVADASIRAPFNGSVKERKVNLGEYLKVQSPVIVLVRAGPLRARLDVPEKWAAAVRTGATVDVHLDAFPNEVFHGQLVRINPTVNPDSRSFQVEAMIPNSDNRLKPGFFVQASMPSEIEEKIVTIPGDALVYTFGTYKVFVVNGERVVERAIKPGTQNDTPQGVRVQVLEGLKPGERVAAGQGTISLYDGAPVHDLGH